MELFQPKLILVPTDFSEPAAHALRYASALGERFGAHLLVVYADPFTLPIDFTGTAPGNFEPLRDQMVGEAREQLVAHAELNISTRVPFDTRVIVGAPVNAILDQARESGANLLVMGTHGRSGVRRLLVGSVTEAVVRAATIPVIAVTSSTLEDAGVRKVLCPVTFTAASREALRYAAALVDARNAPLILFRAGEERELQNTIKELIRLQEWAPRELVDRCEVKILPTRIPVEQIVEFAKVTNADLIAVGVPADRTLTEVLRGTIAERVMQHSGCPVLMVNELTARRTSRQRESELAHA